MRATRVALAAPAVRRTARDRSNTPLRWTGERHSTFFRAPHVPDCWGALDVLLPNINSFLPQPHAVALDYVHVSHIDGQTLRRIATDFPESRRAIRTWSAQRHSLPVLEVVPRI